MSAIRKILQHCGLWHDPPPRAPPGPAPPSQAPYGSAYLDDDAAWQVDPEFLEYVHRQEMDVHEQLWEP